MYRASLVGFFLFVIFRSINGQCNDSTFRITNNNVLEVCEDTIFHSICSDGFSNAEARAACRHLGYVDGVNTNAVERQNTMIPISSKRFDCPSFAVSLTDGVCTVTNASECPNNLIQEIFCSDDFLSFLRLDYPGANQESIDIPIDTEETEIDFGRSIPVGDSMYDSGIVHSIGALLFGSPGVSSLSDILYDSSLADVVYPFVPYSSEQLIVSIRIQDRMDNPNSPHLDMLSRYIRGASDDNQFTANFMILIEWEWDDGNFEVQSAIVSDFSTSHMVYIYRCRSSYLMGGDAGVTLIDAGQSNFRYSDTPFLSQMACINSAMGIPFYTLYFSLESSTPVPFVSTAGRCVSSFFSSSCCGPLQDPTISCAVGSSSERCYCDALCFSRDDCCSDIGDVVQSSIVPCLPLCNDGTVNNLVQIAYDQGPAAVCNNGYPRFMSEEGSQVQASINQDVTCLQFSTQSNSTPELSKRPKQDVYPIYRETITCSGLEHRIQDCPFEIDEETTDDISNLLTVDCRNESPPDCTNGDIRLVLTDDFSSTAVNQGLVEICALRQWNRVCLSDANDVELPASLCRFLNFTNITNVDAINIMNMTQTIGVTTLNCSSATSSIHDCNFGLGQCSNNNYALSCNGDLMLDTTIEDTTVTIPLYVLIVEIVGPVLFVIIVIIIVVIIVVICKRKRNKKNKGNPNSILPSRVERQAGNEILLNVTKAQDDDTSFNSMNEKRYVSEFSFNNSKSNSMASVRLLNNIDSDILIPNYQLRLLDCVGQGEFGLVYKAHYLKGEDVDYVAVKTLKGVFDQHEIDDMLKETIFMKDLDHPNVMKLLGICLDAPTAPYIILPFMTGGSLLHYLKKNRSNLLIPGEPKSDDEETETKLLSMCLQIAKGMEYIAGRNLVHRDLAARNCMIDYEGIIKVSDFGLSTGLYEKMYFRQEKTDSVKLPIKWMAMESIEDGIFSEKTDVWSFGVTCWEIFSGGKTPFGGIIPFSIPKLLLQGQRLERPYNTACSERTYDEIMLKCWAQSPDDRPNFSSLVTTIDGVVTSMAGYLDFNNFNLNVNTMSGTKTPIDTDDELED